MNPTNSENAQKIIKQKKIIKGRIFLVLYFIYKFLRVFVHFSLFVKNIIGKFFSVSLDKRRALHCALLCDFSIWVYFFFIIFHVGLLYLFHLYYIIVILKINLNSTAAQFELCLCWLKIYTGLKINEQARRKTFLYTLHKHTIHTTHIIWSSSSSWVSECIAEFSNNIPCTNDENWVKETENENHTHTLTQKQCIWHIRAK